MFNKKKRTHQAIISELKELENQLEIKAASDYQENGEDLKNCSKCNIPPVHSYDSFGMPMHTLKCPKCGRYECGKFWEDAQEAWNELQEETSIKK